MRVRHVRPLGRGRNTGMKVITPVTVEMAVGARLQIIAGSHRHLRRSFVEFRRRAEVEISDAEARARSAIRVQVKSAAHRAIVCRCDFDVKEPGRVIGKVRRIGEKNRVIDGVTLGE